MNLGYIDYLNCYPFYYHMFEKEPVGGVEVFPGHPSFLNNGMTDGTLDMSPVSSASYAAMRHRVSVLPDFCLSSEGYVKSVVLYSHMPIEDLHGKTVGLTTSSQTSVVLLKILLEKFYQVKPVYIPVAPEPDMTGVDARLVIGNDAMVQSSEPVEYTYDLGDLWQRKTGHPVVFALFTVQNSFLENNSSLVKQVVESYNKSLRVLDEKPAELIAAANEKYSHISYNVEQYYKIIKFRFLQHHKDALAYYFELAAELGLLEQVEQVTWAEL